MLTDANPNVFYLGDPNFDPCTALTWVTWDSVNILVSVEECERYRVEMEEYNHDPENISEPPAPQPADLIAAECIDPILYFFTGDGNWKETGLYAKPFNQCKATFLGSEPAHHIFAVDFPRVEENVRVIIEMARAGTNGELRGLYQDLHDGRNLQKFCHKMFTVCLWSSYFACCRLTGWQPLEEGERAPTMPREYVIPNSHAASLPMCDRQQLHY